MNEPRPNSPRSRLQALLAIPERQRTEAEWDEINELEIMLAPGNREDAPDHRARRNGPPQGGQPKPGGNRPHNKNPQKKMHKRPRNGKAP